MITLSWVLESTRRAPGGGDLVNFEFGQEWIDGTVGESYEVGAEVTTYPVERSADISDHSRPKLKLLTLECAVSNNPLDTMGLPNASDPDRRDLITQTIDSLIDRGVPVDVESDRQSWEGFIILDRSEIRDSNTGDGANFSLSLREFKISELETTEAPSPRVERGRRRADAGRQPPEDTGSTETVSREDIAESASVIAQALGIGSGPADPGAGN